jgi:hypothetical protein
MYRSIFVERTCPRCGESWEAEIQFKTGLHLDGCERYRLGEVVLADEGLKYGQTYRGSSWIYCEACSRTHRTQYESAKLGALADLIENAGFKLRKKGTDQWISASDLRAKQAKVSGDRPWEEEDEDEPGVFMIGLGNTVDVVWDGVAATFSNQAYRELSKRVDEMIDRQLREEGWPRGIEFIDWGLTVYLDSDSRIRISE